MTLDLLSEYRKRAGLTQKEVGDHIGISSQAVSKWENGQAEPDIDTLYRLAELYNTTVDELVGRSSGGTNINKEEKTKLSAVKDFVSKYKKIIIISAAAILALVVAIIIILSVRAAHEEERLYKNYEKLEIGMTMKEVEKVLGKADETEAKYFEDVDGVSAGMAWATYGYINVDFWYYRGEEYDKNVKADNEFDLEYEYLPYYQLRVTFNAEGKLVEAYFNTETEYFSLGDYGAGEDKKIKSVEYLDGAHEEGENKENVKIFFEDGSAFLGEVKFATNYNGEEYIDHPWGELVVDQK